MEIENDSHEFQVRLLKNEGVGLLTDRSGGSYLILDSLNYWYDLIQSQTPKKQKCSCKNDWFNMSFRYIYRDDSPNVHQVQVITTCVNCGEKATRMSIDIDYSHTERLVSKPVTFCEKPNIKYKYNEIFAMWTPEDFEKFLRFMMEELQLTAYYFYFNEPEHIRIFEPVTLDWAIQRADLFLHCYFTQKPIDITDVATYPDERGVMINRNLWRKGEIVLFDDSHVSYGLYTRQIQIHYNLKFCTQYIERGEVVDKPKEFFDLTA